MKMITFYKSSVFLKIVFVLSIAIIFFISAVTYKHITEISKTTVKLSHTYNVTLKLEKLFALVKDLEISKRDYVLTQDETIKFSVKILRKNIENSIDDIQKLTIDNPVQQKNIVHLKELIHKKYQVIDTLLVKDLKKDTAVDKLTEDLLSGQSIIYEIQHQVEKMMQLEGSILSERQSNYLDIIGFTPIFIYLILLITITLIIIAYVKINKDIEAVKRFNDNLLVANESSRLAEEIGSFGKWEWDIENNKYTYSNNIYKLLGHEPQSFEPSLDNFLKHVHPDDIQYVKTILDKMMDTKLFYPFKYRIIRANDGQIRHFFANNRLIKDKSNKEFLLGTTTDITDEVLANKAIEERNRELELNNNELQAFNYVASHDLQEPLRKIQTFISRLADSEMDNLSESGQTFLKRIQAASLRMRLLIDDLLQFSRTTRTEKISETVDLNELLENSKLELNQNIEDKNAEIRNDILPILNVIPFQIQQLFTNLINNSLKYSKENIPPQIDITVSKTNAEKEELLPENSNKTFHKIVFKDNGIGFEQEYAEKIFILFHRLHNREEYDGTGIGLAICKKIVENHKGYIFAQSEKGKGATFIIYLPTES